MPRYSSSKTLTKALKADVELKKNTPEGLFAATLILEEIAQDPSFRKQQVDVRINICTTLAAAYSKAKAFKKQEELLLQLLSDNAFKPYLIPLKVSLGHCYLAQDILLQTSKLTKELLRTPKRRLSSQDAEDILSLLSKMEKHAELKLTSANLAYKQKEYKTAQNLYQYLFEASKNRAFPLTLSKQNFKRFQEELQVRLAACYFCNGEYDKCLQVFAEQLPEKTSAYTICGLAEKMQKNYQKAFSIFSKVQNPTEKVLWEACFCASNLETSPELEKGLRRLFEENHTPCSNYVHFFIGKGRHDIASLLIEIVLPVEKDPSLIETYHWLYILSSVPESTEKTLWLSDEFLQRYPKSDYFAPVLHQKALASWKQNSQELAIFAFSLLEKHYPNFKARDEVLFFLGLLREDKGINAKNLFYELFTRFADSKYAPESYFRYYPEALYASNDVQAIAHLRKMPKAYAHTPFGILATFYVATQNREDCPQKDLTESQTKLLQDTLTNLDDAILEGRKIVKQLPPKMQSLFSLKILQAEYERALTAFTLAKFQDVAIYSDGLKADILALPAKERPHLLWHKASFLKSRAQLLLGNESQAREELCNLLEYAASSGFEVSEAHLLALCDLAQGKAREGDFDTAFRMLDKAIEIQQKGLKTELLLEVLIAKAQLHRKVGEYDVAMMLLSSIINEKSASSLRIQAMFLRAELYELKGRRDLAFRQLQATVKKGGEWGNLAKKKLEEKYGYG